MPQSLRSVTLSVLSLLLLAGCASVSVDGVRRVAEAKRAPDRIYVRDFATPPHAFRVDRPEAKMPEFRREFARQLSINTVERIKNYSPAVDATWEAVLPDRANAWLVTGRFVRVNQGSRALRTAVGLGLGGTKLETEVTVYDISVSPRRKLLTFRTTGGSNAQPGVLFGLVMPNYWLMGLDTAGHLFFGLSVDTVRTSREIAATISEYMAQEQLIPPDKRTRAKKLGKWP
jgi:hypothetical protein